MAGSLVVLTCVAVSQRHHLLLGALLVVLDRALLDKLPVVGQLCGGRKVGGQQGRA